MKTYTSTGKEVLCNRVHFADCMSVEDAVLITLLLNNHEEMSRVILGKRRSKTHE